ncbi:PREDICTED: protein Wnt-11b-2-like [Nicrophorus vespilloides]|uniref:Protein Wnt n=1 Tax=Nicrophorus vespilloides TaxID=110193 RepID=A0ABM1N302_NICVS|nr:PREDICTED: protein Wnt-11b-2-like [Nicrophorus vespilloides]
MDFKIFINFLIILNILYSAYAIRWLSLQRSHLAWNSLENSGGRGIRSGVKSPCSVARRRYGFAKLQTKLCRNSLETMPYVQSAAQMASETCKVIFEDRRWNCSSIDTAPSLTPDLLRATREQAFVYAISSAALTFSMARACANGGLYHCACSSPPKDPPMGNFKWGGCGDNVKWGTDFAKRFVDAVEKHNTKKAPDKTDGAMKNYIAAVNLHNNKIGRKVVSESLITQCKCHGVSGSCSIKTCWRGIPAMKEIGQRLLRKFTNAKEIQKGYMIVENDVPEVPGRRSVSDQFVYLTKSPDYCTRDDKLGSLGTVGRKCNVTSNGTDSCRQLCCGRGYRTVVEEKIERCQCKYYYCCYVKCKTCRTLTQTHECS